MLSAPRSRVVGDEMAGIVHAAADGRTLLLDLRVTPSPAASYVHLAPRQARRELLAGGRSLTETVVLPERTGGLVVQWLPAPGAELPLEVRFGLPGGMPQDGERTEAGVLRADDPGGAVRLFRLDPAPSRWTVEPEGGASVVTAAVAVPAGGVATLAAAAGPTLGEAAAALDAAARGRVHEVRAERALAAARQERLALHTGLPELDEGLEWAKARLEGAGARRKALSGGTAPAGAFLALGHAAAGSPGRALEIAAALSPESAEGLLARGWVTAWTGARPPERPGQLRRAAEALLAGGDDGAPERRIFARAAVAAAADVLDALGDRGGAEALRAALPARPVVLSGEPTRSPGRPLPVVGAPPPAAAPAPTGAAVLAAVLGVPASPPPDPGSPEASGPPERALGAWALCAAGHAEEGWRRARRFLGTAVGDAGGFWPASEEIHDGGPPAPDDPLAAALAPALVLHGLLGARPDAPFGRLRLAPAFQPFRGGGASGLLPSWRVTGIRLGEAVLELGCRVEEGRHTFVLRPTAGPVPATLVFEPSVAGGVEAVEVDGAPADVERETAAGRTRIRLQIPVDRERRITLVGTDD